MPGVPGEREREKERENGILTGLILYRAINKPALAIP